MKLRLTALALALLVPSFSLADAPIIYDNNQSSNNATSVASSDAASVAASGGVQQQTPLVNGNNNDEQQSVASVAPSNVAPVDTSSLTLQQRVSRLEQQMANLQQLNLSNEIQQLHQDIQTLQGTVAEQAHELQQLQSQQQGGAIVATTTTGNNSAANSASSSPVTTPTNPPATASTAATTAAPAPSGAASTSNTAAGVAATAASAASNNANTANSSNSNAGDDQKAYVAAYQLIQNKEYTQAIAGMQAYIQQYPKGQYVANSHYWLGEMYALSGDSNKAQTEFGVVANTFATSDKAPDAMLNLGFIAYDQNQFPQAKQWWQTVVQKYPNSAAARLASQRLQSLQKSGN